MRLARRTVRWLTRLLLAPVLLVLLLGVALRTPWVETELRQRVSAALADATGGRVSIATLRNTLLAGIRVRDLFLRFPGGARIAAADLSATGALPALLAGRIEIGTLRLRGVWVRVLPAAPGWGFEDPATAGEGETPVPTLRVGRVVVHDGRIDAAVATAEPPWRVALDRLTLDGSFAMDARQVDVTVARLEGVPRGIALSPVSGRARISIALDDGDLSITGLDLATRRSRLAGDASIAAGRRLAGRLEVAPLAAGELRAVLPQVLPQVLSQVLPEVALRSDVSGTIVARGPWRRVGVRAALTTPAAGAVRLFGRLDAGAPGLAFAATLRTRHLDLAALDAVLPASDLSGRVRGRGVVTALDPPLSFRLRHAPSQLASQRITAARLAGRLVSPGGVDARGSVATPAGRALIDGRLSWVGDASYQATARVRVDDLSALAPGLPGAGRARARIEGRGVQGPARTATLWAQLEEARVAGVPLDAGTATITLRGNLLALDAGTLVAAGLRGDASGTLDLGRQTLDAAGRLAGDIAPAARAAGADLAGQVSAQGSARGPLRALAVETAGSLERVRAGGTTLARADVRAALTGIGGEGPAGRLTADFAGLRSGDAPPWTGTAAADWQRAGGADAAAVELRGRSEDDAGLAARASVRRAPTGDATAEVTALTLSLPEQPAWRLAGPARLTLAGGTVAVDLLQLTADGQHVTLAGRAGGSGPADVTLEWREVALAPLCRLRGLACAGRTTGTARLDSVAADPRGTLAVRADELVVEDSPPSALTVTGEYAGRSLALRGALTHADAGTLDVAGTVPVDLAWDGPRRDLGGVPVELTVRTDGVDLALVRLVAPGQIRESEGRLVASLRLTGTWDDLRADGTLALRDGRLLLAATGVRYEQIELRAVARGDSIELERLTARAGDGTLEGSGTLALVATRTTPFALRVQLRDFLALSLPAYEAASDGGLTVEGTLAHPVVRGDLTLTRLVVRPTVLTQTSGPSPEPDPTIEVIGVAAAPAEPEPARPPLDVADALSLDVAIHVVRDAWIRRTDADVELRGDLRLGKEAYRPLFVTGEIQLVRGWYAFQGRRFGIDEGRIVFGGDVPPDPQLDIRAIHKAGDYEVTVAITGRASEPALALSSSPPLEQADILSVLVLGRPARDLGRDEKIDLQRQAMSLASGYVMPELRQSMMNTLGLDTFELGDQGLRAGRYVTRDVFVTLAQDFTGRAGQTMGVEYAVTRRLSLKLSTSTQGNSAVDLLWRRRY